MGWRLALAVHPDSGQGTAARMAGTVAARLRAEAAHLELITPASPERFRQRVADCRTSGLDALVVLGGDGAAHQAVQCCAGTDVSLGLVPCGTGNDFARALGIPRDPRAALDALVSALRHGRRRPPRRLDLGRVDGADAAAARWFGTVLCTGFDAAVNARANSMPWPRGPRRYDVALLQELMSLRPRPVVVDTDAGRLTLRATLVAVGNTAFYGGGIPICPSAVYDDGAFDVTVVGPVSPLRLARILPRLRTGTHVRHPSVHTLRASRVHVAGAPEWPVFADGDPVGALPVSVTCVPGALSVLG
ncbi:diacylglycerol/lipid kinase family protein [Saccharomonospora cyanea]|uniref:Sphingosine/diacylglycerol kinase-like enzyme n=1 Tax=Saccharomonospora cyanea NA-134 TaxID=882082 RepID=H5XID1_9PSEU|nr:diacylglycerol kinase family protein [Saccharomonospora cyanea]EHR61759.1 sphingosine/diacylglycerol kinase-like enzyme [Saccharomonospora cyanea NA-134]